MDAKGDRMTTRCYTTGYAGKNPEDLLRQIVDRDARLLDIRLYPTSKQNGWNKAELQALFGGAYHHLSYLGNKAKFGDGETGAVEIVNLQKGLEFVERELQRQPVVLMCACRRWEHCHRRVVAEALWARGIRTEELPDEDGVPESVGVPDAEDLSAEETSEEASDEPYGDEPQEQESEPQDVGFGPEAGGWPRRLRVLVTEDVLREGRRGLFDCPLALAISEACCAVGKPTPWVAVFQGPSHTLTYEARTSPDNYAAMAAWHTQLGGVDIALPPCAAIFQSAWMAGPKSGPFVVARKGGVVTMRPCSEIVQPFAFELVLP